MFTFPITFFGSPPAGGGGGYSFLRAFGEGSTTNAGFTSAPQDMTGAGLLVAGIHWYTGGGAATISDSLGNTWTALTQRESSNGRTVRLFYAVNPTVSAAQTFTVTSGGGTYPSLTVLAFAGQAASPFDAESGFTNGAAVTSIQPGAITPVEDNELLVTIFSASDVGALAVDGGFTIAAEVPYAAGLHQLGAAAYKIQTLAGAENPTWSWTNAIPAAAAMAAFKAAL